MYRRLMLNLISSLLLVSSACASFGSPTPVLDSQGPYSLETRTGIDEIDNVIAAVASADRAQLEELIEYTTVPCATHVGLGGPPNCREGESEGTLVEAFPGISGEGSFIRREEIDTWDMDADALFAVYRVSEDGVEEEYYPRGEYAIVFPGHENRPAVILRVLDGRIVRVDYVFYESLRQLKSIVEQDASEVILMPDIR